MESGTCCSRVFVASVDCDLICLSCLAQAFCDLFEVFASFAQLFVVGGDDEQWRSCCRCHSGGCACAGLVRDP